MTSWLLVEQPGPWPRDALETTLGQVFAPDVVDRARSEGLRPMLVRRPGRHERPSGAHRTVFVGGGVPGDRWLERFEITELADLAAVDLSAVAAGRRGHGEPVDGPLFLVCTHGTKDMCCAVLGRPLAGALARRYPERSWEVSHVGGDRWAGNLLVVPNGCLYGQLTPADATRIADVALTGRVYPDGLRGRTSARTPWEQSAEIAVRRRTGRWDLDAVLAVGQRVIADDTRVVLVGAGGARYEVTVRRARTEAPDSNRCVPTLVLSEYVADAVRQVGTAAVTAPR
jgi:hypothetical protein